MKAPPHLANKILLTPSPSSNACPCPQHYMIYFIPGNPGLIAYYTTFLQHLHHSLVSSSPSPSASPSPSVSTSTSPSPSADESPAAPIFPTAQPPTQHAPLAENAAFAFTTYGASLCGFEQEHEQAIYGAAAGEGGKREGEDTKCVSWPLDLRAQIAFVERELEGVLARCDEEEVDVILIGHSVGAYILLEILRRWGDGREGGGRGEEKRKGRLVGGVCLFPTVMHIGRSRSGRVFVKLSAIPYFDVFVSNVAYLLTCLIPTFVLAYLVRLLLRMPSDAAYTTATFVKNRNAVRQSLYMAADEMRTITHDRWDERVWGAARSCSSSDSTATARPKLFFLFGRNDHWVADSTRDDLIAARAYREGEEDGSWKPKMEVDETGLPHGFCIHHSVPVAVKVKGYIEEIVRADMARTKN